MASLQLTIDTNVDTWCRYRYRYPDNFELSIPIVKKHPGIDALMPSYIIDADSATATPFKNNSVFQSTPIRFESLQKVQKACSGLESA